MRTSQRTLVAVTLALALSVGGPLWAAPGEVEEIEIFGLQRMTRAAFLHGFDIRPGDPYDEALVRTRFRALWDAGWFEDIRIEREDAPGGGVALIVYVKERPMIASLTYEELSAVTRTEIEVRLFERGVTGPVTRSPLRAGSPVDQGKIVDAEGVIRDLMAEKGFLDATVEAKVDRVTETSRAIHFGITPGGKTRIKKINPGPGFFDERLADLEERLGSDHPTIVRLLTDYADVLARNRDHAAARPLLERALEMCDTTPRLHSRTNSTLTRLDVVLQWLKDYAALRLVRERQLKLDEESLRERGLEEVELLRLLADPDHVRKRNELAWVLRKLGEFSEEVRLYEQSLEIQQKHLGPDHPDLVDILEGLGLAVSAAGDQRRARALYERALAIYELSEGEHPLQIAEYLERLAVTTSEAGLDTAASEFLDRALRIHEDVLGRRDHPDLVTSLWKHAKIRWKMLADFDGARLLLERGLAIDESSANPDVGNMLATLNNLAYVLRGMGDYAGAISTLRRALGMADRLGWAVPDLDSGTGEYFLRRGNPGIWQFGLELWATNPTGKNALMMVLLTSAQTLRQIGDFTAAREFLEHASAMAEANPEVASAFRLWITFLRAGILVELGDLVGARESYEEAIEFANRPHASLMAHIPGLLLVQLHFKQGNYEEGRELLNEVYGRGGAAGDSIFEAMARRAAGEYEAARILVDRALEAPELAHILDSEETRPRDLCKFASFLAMMGHADRAKLLFERCMPTLNETLGSDNPDLADIWRDYSVILWLQGAAEAALDAALRAEEIGREHFLTTIRTFSEREALSYALVRESSLDLALSILARNGDSEFGQRVWDAVIRSRALVLDEIATRRRTAQIVLNPELVSLTGKLVSARTRLANLTVRGPDDNMAPEIFRKLLGHTRREKVQLERALAEQSLPFRKDIARKQVGWLEVLANVPAETALVSFVVHTLSELPQADEESATTHLPTTKDRVYAALVLPAGAKVPVRLTIGSKKEIEDLVARWRRVATRGLEALENYREVGGELRRKIWDPLATHLEGAKRVFIVPDGALNLVSFAALPVGESGYLLEQDPLIHYLSAERDIVAAKREGDHDPGLLALGGPDYDRRGPADTTPTQEGTQAPVRVAALRPFRGERSGCNRFESMRFKPLPASAREAEDVVVQWNRLQARRDDSRLSASSAVHLTGAAASEAAFKEQALGKTVLHLATHGFFLGGPCESGLDSARDPAQVERDDTAPIVGENPLLLSGLALAGANRRSAAGPGEEDGILTAEEIAAMDLSTVELAVLSACDTGVGWIQTGEGVFGLRRAFQAAGVRTLIMSLWPVEDESARRWMKALYEGLWEKQLGTAEAVREASLSVLRWRREEGWSTHPFFWAGFVAAGDWRF